MDAVRYVNAPLSLHFGEASYEDEDFKREFDSLASSDDDSVGEWLRLAKARGDTSESDTVLLTLVVELHRKIDELNQTLKGEEPLWIPLKNSASIIGIGYGHFKLSEALLKEDTLYYGRIAMPVFPKRNIAIYFKAFKPDEGKIELIHERDEKDWNAYVVARERIMIREMRAKKNDN